MGFYTLVFRGISFLFLFATLQSGGCRKDVAEKVTNPLYGTLGAAGGFIFYDKGYYSDGWRYLEAAPEDVITTACWGFENIVVSGALSSKIGGGEQNTRALVTAQTAHSFLPGCETKNTAAMICEAYSWSGYSDWFIPSFEEMNLLINNLYAQGKGQFSAFDYYWTSTALSGNTAYAVIPKRQMDGVLYQEEKIKSDHHRIRLIRAY